MFGALKRYIPWLMTSVLAGVLILSNDNPQIKAIRSNYTNLLVVTTKPLGSVLQLPQLWRENRQLHLQLARMSLMLAQRVESGNEVERLREMLKLSSQAEYQVIAAEVIALGADPSVRGIIIDRGFDQGVRENLAVIDADGLVGKVYSVGKSSAQVQLLLDPNFGVAGRLLRGQEECIVRPGGGGKLMLKGIPSTSEIVVGDSVITSGLGGVFPPGLFIGLASEVKTSRDDWLLEVKVQPAVDFRKMNEVFVVMKDQKSE